MNCPRLDRHAPHEFIAQGIWHHGNHIAARVEDCPGAPVIEGGSLEVHDCGARVHPDDIRDCCLRCESTICPECSPCRRIA